MLSFNAFLFFSALLLIAALCEPLADKLRLPYTIILVVIGFVGSEIATGSLGIDTGVRWQNFHWIIFYLILPVLVFRTAINIRFRALRDDIVPIMMLAIPLMLLSTGIIAVVIYYGIHHPTGFPWIAALLTGALLSATDPAAVIALLNRAGASRRLSLLLEGESMFNDATAIVLFSIIIAMAQPGGENPGSWPDVVLRFLAIFFGGLLVGLVTGWMACLLIRLSESANAVVLITLITAYAAYTIAEVQFHVSGVMAVLGAGLCVGTLDQFRDHDNSESFTTSFWRFINWLAESLIFLLAGISITLTMFTDNWLAMLIGIAAVLVARVVIIQLGIPVINVLPGVMPLSFRQRLIMTWGGVRGTVTLALALSLPLSLGYWYTVQSIAYGVVLFTLFFQATTMKWLVESMNLQEADT